MSARAVLLRGSLAAAIAASLYSQLQTAREGTLNVEIREQATGRITPAMVCITNLSDGTWRIPVHNGQTPPKYTTARDFYFPLAWKAGDPGYARLTIGEFNDNDVRSNIYKGIAVYPFWKEPAAYFISRPFSIRLPAGKWRLAVERGIEYLPVAEDFQVRPGENLRRKLALRRWVDMPAMGWYSGDDHVHFPRASSNNDDFLMTWARAEDVHMVNVLRMGDIQRTYFEQKAYGKSSHHEDGEYALASGQEDPRDVLGHAIALDIPEPVRDVSRYFLYDTMFDKAHEQGGITGYAHLAWSHPLNANLDVPRRKVDFAEILQFRRLGTDDYYDFLNLGFHLTASAGSDLPWGGTIGEARVYAYTGKQFSPERWYSAFRQGHTFVTNGPMLSLQAGSAIPGDQVQLRRADTLTIKVRTWAPPETGLPRRLELIADGKVIQSKGAADGTGSELRFDYRLALHASTWITARVETQNGGFAHTSPIYVTVDKAAYTPSREAIERRRGMLDQITPRLQGKPAPGLEERIAEAARIYNSMMEATR